MRFVCCRSSSKYRRYYSFEEAVVKGWSDDGGMILPALDEIPYFDSHKLRNWADLPYEELCYQILSHFIPEDEIPADVLRSLLASAFGCFGSPEVVTVKDLGQNLQVVELWHGPTAAFKVLAELLSYFMKKREENLTLLVGTSGDTGSSAIHSVLGKDNMNLVVLFPKGRISEVQELQMTSVGSQAPNVKVVGVEGTSDDLDVPIEALFRDLEFRRRNNLGSVNSVNICRLLVQIVHYFYAYLRHDPTAQSTINFSIPTGAGGHVTAGILGRLMGLPVNRLIVATNENDIFSRWLKTGTFARKNSVQRTTSPSMDIQVPYNIERVLFLFANGTGHLVSKWMREFRETGKLEFSYGEMERIRTLFSLRGHSITDQKVLATISEVHREKNYPLDPHTAVGVAAALEEGTQKMTICMGCAHAVKFLETLGKALNSSRDAAELLTSADRSHPHVTRILGLRGKNFPYDVFPAGTDWKLQLRSIVTNMRGSIPASTNQLG